MVGRLRRPAVAVAAALALTAALGANAHAQQVDIGEVQSVADTELGVTSAHLCKDAHGPGDWNEHCIDVKGRGLKVDTVQAHLSSTVAPYFPGQIDGVTVYIWGVLFNGTKYERQFRNNSSGRGTLGAKFQVNDYFKHDSLMCARVVYDPARTPEPVCIKIKR
ncbi:hypothetical protein [Amycolatopsis keratiniphila]|uniref:hypothetical protein n=1 Tax=Amycolatopsis keratiniphila TaxID=129921 RepID=UPI0011801CBF|nr:hypothetical protein [Amycolatopsis keratiniphila]